MPEPVGQNDDWQWATPEDAFEALMDSKLYGTVFARRGEDGLLHRVDPRTITVAPTGPPTREELFTDG